MSYLDQIVEEYSSQIASGISIENAIDNFNFSTNGNIPISEAEYNKSVDHLKLEVLDIDRFVKVNDCPKITNPVFYDRNNNPTEDGLLSNELFGITQDDRANIFGYIDLGSYYLDPSCYKNWVKIDSNIKRIVHKEGKFIINNKGEIVEDPSGFNGLAWLHKNIDKVKFKQTDSLKRDLRIRYLEKNKSRMFINKYLVIPPYYRDTNTGKRSVGVGGVNKIYSQLIIAVNSLKSTQEFGFDLSGPMEGRVQEILVALYDWFAGNTNNTIQTDTGSGLSSKLGLMRHTLMGKTINYSARLVITNAELKANRPEDMVVDFDKSFLPLAACIACFRPFVQFYVRSFFETEFIGTEQFPVFTKDGKLVYKTPKYPMIVFSDERIKKEMESFLHARNNRFVPIKIPIEEDNRDYYLAFQGRFAKDNEPSESIFRRRLTWCDIFFQACIEAVKNRMVVITRYPVDTRFNEIFTLVEVASTKETEPMLIDGQVYKLYPKIREEDIGTYTDTRFVDTLSISNLYLAGLNGDYDGDTVTVKALYTNEANEEIKDFVRSKGNFIDLGSANIRSSSADVIQSIYNLTKILQSDTSKITQPTFK